ncbi:MAG: peptidoglycan D,D-transpeptidase FtsI family protein [Burkholderiaceae bacterium]
MIRKPGTPRTQASRGRAVSNVTYANSPLLASKTPLWRSRFLVVLVGIGSLVLIGRAAVIQIISNDFYLKQGEARYAHTLEVPASRGRIIDRNGLLLAASVKAPSIWAIPKDVDADKGERKQLAQALGMSLSELDDRLDGNPNFVWLKRQVDDAVWRQVKALDLKGIHQVSEYRREYPQGEAAAHVVGFTGDEEKGQEGIELAYQQQLQGRDGTREVVKDRLGNIVEDIGDPQRPVDGEDIELAIDSKVQFFAYQRIRDQVIAQKAKSGSVVVIDTKTGEVLALANYPSYDPSDRHHLSGAQLRNRALTDVFEPGSTMKPFIVGTVLEKGLVTPYSLVDATPGSLVIGGFAPKDAEPNGVLTVQQVIQKSSNIGAARLAMKLTPKEEWEKFSSIGLGQKPQINFPGVVTGRLRPYKTWRPIEQATMAYGYGLSASLFQLARAYTVFANDGVLENVSMLRQSSPGQGTRVFKPETVKEILTMLQMVASPGGTAPKARTLGYSVGGKSGTAYKAEGHGYAQNKYRPWFVGLAPISHPRIVCAVMIDEPGAGLHYGGDVAAPVFSQVVSQTLPLLGVAPDLDVKTQVTMKDVKQVPESD